MCDKLCDIGEYLDYKNCKRRKKLLHKLVEESSENIDGNKKIYNGAFNDHKNVCNSCKIYLILFATAFLIIIGSRSAHLYFHWYLKSSDTVLLILILILKQ